MVVPNAACEPTPYNAIAVAMAISKWLEDPIKTEMIASLYFSPKILVIRILNPSIPKTSGKFIRQLKKAFFGIPKASLILRKMRLQLYPKLMVKN